MSHPFDPGCTQEPFLTLCRDYPDSDVYPSNQFRVEWGPIFYRGRLDGSAHILVIGQDPAQHETVVRRILVGEAGRRAQGFLKKLGFTRSYVFINTFLYSVYGSVKSKTASDTRLVDYRNAWIKALLDGGKVEAVVALGQAADQAWTLWKATPQGSATTLPYAPISHPTRPESASKGDKAKLVAETRKLLQNWNGALTTLAPKIKHPDVPIPHSLSPYGTTWADTDRVPIPKEDFPAGLPSWMQENDGWADRKGKTQLAKRRNITITVPSGVVK